MNKSSGNSRSGRHGARALALQALYEWQISSNDPTEIAERLVSQVEAGEKVDFPYFQRLY